MKITKRELIEAVELAWNVAECADLSCGPMVHGTKVGDDGIEYTIVNMARVNVFNQLLAAICPRLPVRVDGQPEGVNLQSMLRRLRK